MRENFTCLRSSVTITSAAIALLGAWLAVPQWRTPSLEIEAHSGPEALATATCKQLIAEVSPAMNVTMPSDSRYEGLTGENWSQSCWLPAACVAQPTSPADVQKLVRTLAAAHIPFAIRSGGHSPSPRDASIGATGVLISLDGLNQVVYDPETTHVKIGPGARWGDVYTHLDMYDVTMVGGRVMDVGVGGLTLGGGLSYLSDLHGLVCDNVVSFQVVLSDGTLVEANAQSHPDLFWALKGGSNNFGIVTSFTAATYPIKNCWGGMQIFQPDQLHDVLQAYNEYQHTVNKDLHANLVLNVGVTNATVVVTFVYLQPIERPAAYAPFYQLTPVMDLTGFHTLHELMVMFPFPDIQRKMWYTSSFRPSSSMFAGFAGIFQTAPEVPQLAALTAGTLILTLQPIHPNVVLQGQAKGGNALGLSAETQTWFGLNYGWWYEQDDKAALGLVPKLHDRVANLAAEEEVALDFTFMNDAFHEQDVIASYGSEIVARLKEVQETFDPLRVFQELVAGGQKIPMS